MALVHCDFFSEVLRMSTSMDVILPQAAAGQIGMPGTSAHGEHPCLALLHGLSDDHTIWQRRTSIERYVAPLGLDAVYEEGPGKHEWGYWDQQIQRVLEWITPMLKSDTGSST